MAYHLEICRRESHNSDGCIKTFTATDVFLPIHSGDLAGPKMSTDLFLIQTLGAN